MIREEGNYKFSFLFMPNSETRDPKVAMKQDIKQVIDNQIFELLKGSEDLFLVNTKIDVKQNVRVFLDGDKGVAIGSCTTLNRKLYQFIEDSGIFPNNDFSLEVSSFGVEEPLVLLRQYQKNINRTVVVTGIDGNKTEGKLMAADAAKIVVETVTGKGRKAETALVEIPFESVKSTIVQVKF
jgi:ribosome maturation factor RimP